ncbi:B-cell linker protein isoform X2 [Pseudoliparis swirei]|uniref:B-cell linker protein isoform X2 n=1 Tax=Pseudoliparis swirei TaxID=2059687 RepID=UPI0024BDCCC4|nr:B-cell linker protein isoform X2 [Pseudoliparis swirei]
MTMSFFRKQKNLHSGPPAPTRRTDDNAGFEWSQEEFDDEEEDDGDTYEAPPCERQSVTVPQSEVEENVYLENQGKPTPPQRPAGLPPRPTNPSKPQQRADDFSSDPKTKKAPEINRTEKPGRKMMMPPSPVRCAPVPEAASNTEEDVYLDPNEEQEDSDDVYVEPTAACTPATRAPIRVPPSPNTGLVPSPTPVCRMKPPVPRAQSNSLFPSSNELKTASSVEVRRAVFPAKLPPPTPSGKPPLPGNLKEAKCSLLNPPVAETKTAASSGGMKTTKQSGLEDKEWFAGSCNRKTAIDLLLRLNKDGAFLIRHSSAQGGRQPYTLAVLYQQKVFNIPIRFLGETRGYALGKEGKKNEEVFGTLDEMISHHNNNQLLLIDSQSQAKRTTYLTYPARP